MVGCAALEVYPDGSLLRSVAVDRAERGNGPGHRLTEAALHLAGRQRSPAVYLLTTTADLFFPRFGFMRIDRDELSASVRRSVQFTSACPATAIVMWKPLDRAGRNQTISPLRTA
jgi:amino-acid N-acetyltransferase